VEQRTDETARRPGVVAGDTGVPPAEDGQTETVPASEDAGEANGHSHEEESVWKTAAKSDSTYPADSTYAGSPAVDGSDPAGTERDYPAPSGSSAGTQDFPSASVGRDYAAQPSESIYGSSGTQHDFSAPPYPAQVTPSPRTHAESRTQAESDTQADLSPQPEPRPKHEESRPEQPSPWQAAAARMPRPQSVPKRAKAQRAEKSSAPTRQAHLMVSRFEPWSVMKFSFMISLACFVILFVAVTLLYGTLAGLGVFDSIQKALSNVTSGQGTNGVNVSHWFSASTILSYTALLGVLNVFLITAFATVGSVVYNLTAHLVGGVEVTLRETE
jgi:Transmembrane domain of unknown function (DUF3566)